MSELSPVRSIAAGNIVVAKRLRSHIDPSRVQSLADSIQKLGLRTPITIRTVAKMEIDGVTEEDVPVLVAGAHRLAALKLLGIEDAPCIDIGDDAVAAELWEIAENLHRAELTALERDEHIARWVDLAEQQKVAQSAPPGGKQPKEAGVRAATKELGLDRRDVQRARTNASLTPEAKEAAKEVGLDDNRTALLEAAKAEPAQQASIIRTMAEKRVTDRVKLDSDLQKRAVREVAEVLSEHVPAELWDGLKANLYAAKKAADIATELTNITGQSIMDRRYAD
ncbi:MAG TPA: ParB/RepB/Spo0J family partition protein [Terriglobia bacterium]|nr:ParB/RepB/Spo0J family partition protein [Terriglobia bacterium]